MLRVGLMWLVMAVLWVAVPALAIEGRVRKPVALMELARARIPTEKVAAELPPQFRNLPSQQLLLIAQKSKLPWYFALVAQSGLDEAAKLDDEADGTADSGTGHRLEAINAVVHACEDGLKQNPSADAAVWLHYFAGIAELERENRLGATTHWHAALPLATGRMASELWFRLGQAFLDSDVSQALANWHAIDDPQLRGLAAYQEVSWFAGQRFACAKAIPASLKLLQLPVQAELPDAATLAEATILACLADPLEGMTETALPADLPNRAKFLTSASADRDARKWTASSAALELLRRCNELEAPPAAAELMLSGTLAKLQVKSKAKLPMSLSRCVVEHAKKVAIPGPVDARTVIQR
jgi:hypothetical protein